VPLQTTGSVVERPADWIAAGQFDRIRDEVRKSVEAARAVKQEVR
jgi:hypothetical protein